MRGWANSDDFRISIGSPASCRLRLECGDFGDPRAVVITLRRRRKNSLRGLRDCASRLLRSTASPRARPLLRLPPSLSRALGSPGRLLSVRWREMRAARLAGSQSPLHQAVRLLRGPTVPRGTVQAIAQELHLDWHTVKELDKQYMRNSFAAPAARRRGSSASTRSPSAKATATASSSATWIGAADLVRRPRSLRGEPGRVLRLARPREMPQDPPGRDGHVEGVPRVHPQGGACPAGPDHLRQVPCPQAPGGSHGRGAAAGVRPTLGRTAPLHQGRGTTCSLAGRT